jgi:WD40 repeat protein
VKAPESAKSEKGHVARIDRFGDPLPVGAVARIGTARWWCGRNHGPLLYTPDGKRLVSRDFAGDVHILDAASGNELRRLDISDDGRGACFALAPNGEILATGGFGTPMIRIWDVKSGKELRRIEGEKRGHEALAFSPDGKILVAGAYPIGMRLWEIATGKELRRIAAKDAGFNDGIFFLPDGKTVIAGDRPSIHWWDIATGREIRRINRKNNGKPGGFYFLAVSPDGKRVAASQGTNVLFLWDAATGKEIRQIVLGEEFTGSCLCFSPDSQTLACGNGVGRWGNQTLFFAAATGEELRRWDDGNKYTMQLAFSPDGKTVAQVLSHVIRLRDSQTGKPIVPDSNLPDYCMAVRFSRDGNELIVGCLGGRMGTWNPLTGESLRPMRDAPEGFGRRTDMLLGPALTPHGERAALVNAKGVLHVWEPATGKTCCRIAEPPVGNDQANLTDDEKVLVVKHRDNIIRLWDARSGKLLRSLSHNKHVRFPHPHAFSPDGRILAVAPAYPDSGTIHLDDTATGKEQSRLVWGDSTDVSCLLFAPDGKYLLAAHRRRKSLKGGPPERGDEENALRLWDGESRREVRRFPVPGGDIRAMVISPDGKTAAAAVHDTILLWELASGAERGRFTGHREWIRSLAFSPNGRLLASGCLDYTACVWDLTGICPDGQWLPHPVKRDEVERLWIDLGNRDGVRAYRAMWRLAASGPSTVAFLARQVRPVSAVEQERLTRLIADLDSDRFETREHASVELRGLSEQAEPALRKALAARPSLEASRQLRSLLERVENRTFSAEQLHALRAIEVLEHIGSPEARQVLRTLAEGAPAAMLTREAKAALERQTHRSNSVP